GWTWSPPRRSLPLTRARSETPLEPYLSGMRETCSGLSIVLTFRQPVGHNVGKAGLHLYYWLNERTPHMTRNLQDASYEPFAGLRAAVTGGTSGLGLALVRELLGRGARVAFVARDRERVERVVREQGRAHG